jgi:hypothetical protein
MSGLQHRKGAAQVKRRRDRRRHAAGRPQIDDQMQGRCPHKLLVRTDRGPAELRCQIKHPHDEHRHGERTWT